MKYRTGIMDDTTDLQAEQERRGQAFFNAVHPLWERFRTEAMLRIDAIAYSHINGGDPAWLVMDFLRRTRC